MNKETTLDDIVKLVTDLASKRDEQIDNLAASIDSLAIGTKHGFDEVHLRMDKFDTRMDKFDARMDKFDIRMEQFDHKLENIDMRLSANISYHEQDHEVMNDIISEHGVRINVLEDKAVSVL